MVKKIISNIKELFKKNMASFPITNTCVLAVTIISILNIDIDFTHDVIEKMYLFFGCLGVGAYCVETKKINKIFYTIPLIISILFVISSGLEWVAEVSDIIYKLLSTYLITTTIYSIYNNYKNSQKEFAGYLEDIFKGFVKLSFIYGILALSVLIIGLIFDSLIMDISKFDIIEKIEIFILGAYYISNVLYVLKGEDNTNSTVVKGLIRKVLTPLVYISFIIIYMFLFKIITNGETPDSEVFYIISFLFAVDVPILLMASSYKEEKLIDKINIYSSFIFIPFIIVQLYALSNEIYQGGITIESYTWIMFVIFEVLYLIDSLLKKDYGNLFVISIIMTITGILIPFVNAEDLSLYSQYNNLKLYNQNTTYTEIQKNRIYNAYRYINNSKVEEEYFEKLDISEEDIKIIKAFNEKTNSYDENDYEYISANYDGAIDIDGYSELYSINVYNSNPKTEYIDEITIKYGDNKQVEVDFYQQYMKYYRNKRNLENYFEENHEVILDNDYKLILTKLSISYTNDEMTSYRINGYLLTK